MNDDFHNISIDFGKFVYIYLRKFLLVTKRVRGRFVAFSMSVIQAERGPHTQKLQKKSLSENDFQWNFQVIFCLPFPTYLKYFNHLVGKLPEGNSKRNR